MRRAGAVGCVLVFALSGCAGRGVDGPNAEPTPAAEAADRLSPERQRLERWKEGGGAVDPREGFARAAEAEAERRRSEALARGAPQTLDRVELEMNEDAQRERRYLLDRLAELGAWGSSGCFPEEPDLSVQDDWIRYRRLERGDFLEEKEREVKPVVEVPGTETGAYVSIVLSCVIRVRVDERAPDRFEASLDDVNYFSLLSRHHSWWNPRVRREAEWVLRHEQLHFDVAELLAHELEHETERLRETIRGIGPDPTSAVAAFQARWAEHIDRAQKDFREIEHLYDRETKHGTDFQRQTEWFARVKRGLGAVRAGLEVAPTLRTEQP